MVDKKRLMIIGAKWEQLPLIKAAKSHGCFIISTDLEPDPEVYDLADIVEVLDPRNIPRALMIAKKYNIDGVTSDQCDYSRYAEVFIRNRLGLADDNFLTAQVTTNKKWMRELCLASKIKQPLFISCKTFDESVRAVKQLGLPVIVKPVDNRGSFGVNYVVTLDYLEFAFYDAVMNSHSREILIESFVEGMHVTVDGFFNQSGVHINLAIATKKVAAGTRPIITQVNYPADLPIAVQEHLLETNSRVIDALCIKSGLTHSEYIIDESNEIFLVEAANRGGGVLTSAKIIPALTRINICQMLVASALGEPFLAIPTDSSKHIMLGFIIFPPGEVIKPPDLSLVKNIDGLLHIHCNVKQGEVLSQPESGAARHGFAILEGKTPSDVQSNFKRLISLLQPVYSPVI